MSKTCELIMVNGAWVQHERDMTPAEEAELAARKAAPPPVPESISPRQFRQALTHGGYRSAVEAAVAAADQDTKDWYQTASAFERHHPLILSMAQSLNYTSAQLDAVWAYGASI